MTKIFLRGKQLKYGKRGLYLDFYPPVVHPETLQQTRREHLRLYIFERPKSETEKDQNKETRMLADSIRSQRQLELQVGRVWIRFNAEPAKGFYRVFPAASRIQKTRLKKHLLRLAIYLQTLKRIFRRNLPFCRCDGKVCKRF